METECSKPFTKTILWSDGSDAQFRSRFIFQLVAGTLFLNKSLCWYYNERHHGKGPMDGVGGTIKNVIFRKVKLGQIVVHTPKEFSDAALKFVPSIITVFLPRSDEIVEPETIHQSHSIPVTFSIHKFHRKINGRGDCSIEFSRRPQTRSSFTPSGTTKLVLLFMVTKSPIRARMNVQHVANGIKKTEVNGCNAQYVKSGFT